MTDEQRYKCKLCGRQFVLNPSKKRISDETKETIDKSILEGISLAGIARVTKEPLIYSSFPRKRESSISKIPCAALVYRLRVKPAMTESELFRGSLRSLNAGYKPTSITRVRIYLRRSSSKIKSAAT